MRRAKTKIRSINALLIAGILHLWIAILLTFFYYAHLSNEIEDVLGVEFLNMKDSEQLQRRLKRPLPKQSLSKKQTQPASDHRPQHITSSATANLMDETIRPSEQILMHDATEIVSKTSTELQDLTTQTKQLRSRDAAIPTSVSSPYDITAGKGKDSLRQRVKGDGESGFHRLDSTGTADIGDIGSGFGKEKDGKEGKGGPNPFGDALKGIANHIIASRVFDKVNVVFVLDTSASMRDNIQQVAKNLYTMADAFDLANLEYHFGMSEFSVRSEGQEVKTKALMPDVGMLRRRMQKVQLSGDENALDALIDTMNYIDFHADADKHLILVTDEPATTRLRDRNGVQTQRSKVIDESQFQEIRVNVLGFPEPFQQKLAETTGGVWQHIPGNIQNPSSLPTNRAANYKFLKVFRDIATNIRKDANAALFRIELHFEIPVEEGENPIDKIQNEFDRIEVGLSTTSFITGYKKLVDKQNKDLLIITDYENGQIHAIRGDQNKFYVYSGEIPENWSFAENLIAKSYQSNNRWTLTNHGNNQIYTFIRDNNAINVFIGGLPGRTLKTKEEPYVDIVVMLDYSRSMGGKSQAIMLGLSELIGRLSIYPLKYRIGLIRFAVAKDAIKSVDGIDVAQMPLNEVIIENLMEDPFGGDEHLLNAIVEGLPQVKFSPYARRTLLILTDEPTTGNYPTEKAIEICQSLGITVYVIGYPDDNDFQKTLAAKTAGYFYTMPKHLDKAYPNQ